MAVVKATIKSQLLALYANAKANELSDDAFADAMLKIAEEAHTNPELLKEAPHTTPIGRLDEVKAAKELVLCCWLPQAE